MKQFLTLTQDGIEFTATVSPCSWMYPGYGFQIEIRMENGGCVHVRQADLPYEKATVADMDRLFRPVKLVACSQCGAPAFDPACYRTNRDGWCERCFMESLNKTLAEAQARDAKKVAARDRVQKRRGMTHRVDAWIHPNGSDYEISFYSQGEPPQEAIQEILKAQRSKVLTDYTVTKLV